MSKIETLIRKNRDTGTGSDSNEFILITYPFEKYEIVVKLSPDRKFLGIDEVRINKDFRSYRQQTSQEVFATADELPTE